MSAQRLTRASFEGLSVTTHEGQEVELAGLIGPATTVVIFLRHFGCIGCTKQVNDLLPRLPELDALGVQVILVGSGEPPFVAEFMHRHGLLGTTVKVASDPERESYRVAGFERSAWGTFGLRSIARRLQAAGKGATGYRGSGDLLQQGGALVFGPDGDVVLHFVSHGVGDNVDLNEVVERALMLQASELEGVI